MQKAVTVLLISCVLAVIAGLISRRPTPGDDGQQWVRGIPTVEMVTHLSELTTVKVDMADVQVCRIDGVTGGVEATLLVKGDFTVGTDLSAAKFESVDLAARQAVLVLPHPRASVPRLDHTRSRVVTIREVGLWKLVPGEDAYLAVMNRGFRDAQRVLGDASRMPLHRDAASRRAEQVLHAFFVGIGWRVTVKWT